MPAAHAVADEEGHPAGAVIRTVAVVLDAPTEFGEDEDEDVFGGVVFLEVGVEVVNAAGDVVPERIEQLHFVGVGVEAAVLGVADARSDVGGQHLRGVADALGEAVGGVLDAGRVALRNGAEDVRPLERVKPRPAQEVHDGPAADGVGVHVLEGFERLVALGAAAHVVQQPV